MKPKKTLLSAFAHILFFMYSISGQKIGKMAALVLQYLLQKGDSP